ncbi:MAG: glutathione S-transferase N-terminal domain-containing protein [Gammaproteobacteria bacterium]
MITVVNRNSVMVVYSDATNPIDHSVRIVLAEKDINAEVHFVEPANVPRELSELNPYNTSLTLVDRDLVLYDAQIIMEYLDERYPHPPLMPVDPAARAANRLFRYRVERDAYSLLPAFSGNDEIAAASARKSMRDQMTAIAPAFAQMPYFMSEEYSLVDCWLAPLLWRLEYYGVKLPPSAKPLSNYASKLFERNSFVQSLSDDERELKPVATTRSRRKK